MGRGAARHSRRAVVPMLALVDCNSFYCSCEAVFRPALRGRPVAVLSNNDGCVIARNGEAKALGVRMGAPYHLLDDATRRELVVCSSNYTLYGDMSARVMETLETMTPEVEIYSIDEAFLNLAGFEDRGLDAYGREIRARVRQWTGVPVSVGVGRTKTLAKVANHLAKKSPDLGGVLVLDTAEAVAGALAATPVMDVWGIGRQYARWLETHGIATAAQLAACPDQWIRNKMGVVGLRTVYELRGVPCLELELVAPARKGLMVSRSFGRAITTLEELTEAMTVYTTRAGEKLRRAGLAAERMQVFVRTNPYAVQDRQYARASVFRLAGATDYTPDLLRYSLHAVRGLFRPGFRYAKCGVMLLDLSPRSNQRVDLLDERDLPRQERLMSAVDALNARYGRETVFYASAGLKRGWKMRRAHLSPAYSTDVGGCLVVRA